MAFQRIEEEVSHCYEGHWDSDLEEELNHVGERCDDHPDDKLDEPKAGLYQVVGVYIIIDQRNVLVCIHSRFDGLSGI